MACTPALLAAVDVPPDGERVECHLGQRAGIGAGVPTERARQVVTVTPAHLTADALETLAIACRGIIGVIAGRLLGYSFHSVRGWHAGAAAVV